MALAKIKTAHKSTVIAFGNSGLPLGRRDDIDQLAIVAHESNDPYLKSLFEVLPSLAELKKTKVEADLRRVPVVSKPAVENKKPQPESKDRKEENR